jgi:surface polysaccharide O-acyltransferase-like enzyme
MQNQRILFLDLVRGLAILCMILQHTLIMYARNMGEGSDLGEIFLLLGTAPAAPVFLLLMGIFFARSTKPKLKYGMMRGLKLLMGGYLLNLFRFSLPVLITGDHGDFFADSESPFSLLFVVDVPQVAGLSLMVLSLLKYVRLRRELWLVLAIIIVMVSPFLWGTWNELPGTAPLWGTAETVIFPLFPWLIYPLVGMFYSHYVMNDGERHSCMKNTAIMGLVLLVAGTLLWNGFSEGIFVIGDYSRSGVSVHLVIFGFVFLWLSFWWWVVNRFRENAIFRLLHYWSRHVTVIYVIHWLLFGWGILIFGMNQHSASTAFFIGIGILMLTHILTKLYIGYRMRLEARKKEKVSPWSCQI